MMKRSSMILSEAFKFSKAFHPILKRYSQIIYNAELSQHTAEYKLRNQTIPIQPIEWQNVVKEVEKIVGYSRTFLNPRWLLENKDENTAHNLPRLLNSKHPLIKLKSVLSRESIQHWGLVVLLVSKAGQAHDNFIDSQKSLAQIEELMRVGVIVHKSVNNITKYAMDSDKLWEGNKIAVLFGDRLLSVILLDAALLRNFTTYEIICSTLRDFGDCEYLGLRDFQNNLLPSEPNISRRRCRSIIAEDNDDSGPFEVAKYLGNPMEEWALFNVLSGVNHLAKFCQCTSILAKQSNEQQKNAFLFGKHFALAWNLRRDLKDFQSSEKFSLMCAPVMMHLKHDPKLYREIKKGRDDVSRCNYENIRRIVHAGSAMEDVRKLRVDIRNRALKNLYSFESSEAKDLLTKIVLAL